MREIEKGRKTQQMQNQSEYKKSFEEVSNSCEKLGTQILHKIWMQIREYFDSLGNWYQAEISCLDRYLHRYSDGFGILDSHYMG